MNPFGIEYYPSKKTPRATKALYVVAVLALIVIFATA